MATPAQIAERIALLEEAIATGALTVRHADGRSITYQSLADMQSILTGLRQEAAEVVGTSTTRRIMVAQGRGL